MAASATRLPTCAAKSFAASAATRWPVAREVHAPRGVVDEGARRAVLGEALGDVALDLAVLAERHAEAPPLVRVAEHHLEAALRDAERHRGEGEPLDLEVAHHLERALALLAEAVRGGHAHAVEHQLGGEGGAHAELVLPLLAEARSPACPSRRGSSVISPRRGGGVDDEAVAERVLVDAAVGDEGLHPVEHVDVAVALGARASWRGRRCRPRARSCTCRRSTRRSPPSAARARAAPSLPFTFRFWAKRIAWASTESAKPGSERRERLADLHRGRGVEARRRRAPPGASRRAARARRRAGRARG